MVTHDQEAADVADRIVTLTDGQIIEDRRVETAGVA
jgi:ABC-type lipoprotein export system ATPase subunit